MVNVWFICVVLKMLWKDVPIIYSFLSDGGLFDGILCAANFWPKRAVEFFGFERCGAHSVWSFYPYKILMCSYIIFI